MFVYIIYSLFKGTHDLQNVTGKTHIGSSRTSTTISTDNTIREDIESPSITSTNGLLNSTSKLMNLMLCSYYLIIDSVSDTSTGYSNWMIIMTLLWNHSVLLIICVSGIAICGKYLSHIYY